MISLFSKNILTQVITATCLFINIHALAKDITISGDVMIDHDSFESGYLEDKSVDDTFKLSEIRRASVSVKTKITGDWKAKLKVDFANDNAEIKDAYISYKSWDWADVTLGKQKEGFGLEKLSSSSDALMIERSLVTAALAPGRSIGISLAGDAENYNWQVGYYQPDESEQASAVTGRISWLPWRKENKLVHVGVAFSERYLNGSEFRINENMEVHLSDSLLEGEKILADKTSLKGIEFLWQHSGFTSLAEWQHAKVTDISNADYEYQGGYVQLSYQLSGENRKYKNGSLGGISTPGWEFTSRYSEFSLIEEAREAQIYSVGLNYTVNKQLKFMGNYIKAKYDEINRENDASNAISLRVQYSL